MTIWTWLRCKWNGICTIHAIQRDYCCFEGGGDWSECPECEKDRISRIRDKREALKDLVRRG